MSYRCSPILGALDAILGSCLALALISLMPSLGRTGVFLVIALGPDVAVECRLRLLGSLSL